MKRVFLTSIPKCGTHLLLAFLQNLGWVRSRCDTTGYGKSLSEFLRLREQFGPEHDDEEMRTLRAAVTSGRDQLLNHLRQVPPNGVVAEHCIYDEALLSALRELDYQVIFMMRDPRDQLISYRNHALREPGHKNFDRFKRQERQTTYRDLLAGSPSERDGESNIAPVTRVYSQFERWLDAPGVHVMAFEHLVGAKGNGSRLRQLFEADELARRIAPEPETDLDEGLRTMFDEKHTLFVRGQCGVWREEFGPEACQAFETLVRPGVQRYLDRIESSPAALDLYSMDPRNLRRVWRMAERDLAAALAACYVARANVTNLERLLATAHADANERLKVIRRLESRLAAQRGPAAPSASQ